MELAPPGLADLPEEEIDMPDRTTTTPLPSMTVTQFADVVFDVAGTVSTAVLAYGAQPDRYRDAREDALVVGLAIISANPADYGAAVGRLVDRLWVRWELDG